MLFIKFLSLFGLVCLVNAFFWLWCGWVFWFLVWFGSGLSKKKCDIIDLLRSQRKQFRMQVNELLHQSSFYFFLVSFLQFSLSVRSVLPVRPYPEVRLLM